MFVIISSPRQCKVLGRRPILQGLQSLRMGLSEAINLGIIDLAFFDLKTINPESLFSEFDY
jgi:hypothetical protein